MKRLSELISVLSFLLLTGCSSHHMALDYEPTRAPVVASGPQNIQGVEVSDLRDTPVDWLGAIRGGYGNPLKKLYTQEPTFETVHRAFVAALRERQLLDASIEKGTRLEVDIVKLDTSYYFNKEAHAHLDITLRDASGKMLYQRKVRKDREKAGVGAGIFGDVEALADFANETLNEAIDDALNDKGLHAALLSAGEKVAAVDGSARETVLSTTQRLERLERLESSGLLSDQEFRDKRAELIESL